MAVLTSEQLAKVRKTFNSENDEVSWEKVDVNNAIQAIEDWWESNQASLSSAIDTATSPTVFSNPIKKKIGRWWMRQRFNLGG